MHILLAEKYIRSLRKKATFEGTTTGFLAKWPDKQCRNSTLMTSHFQIRIKKCLWLVNAIISHAAQTIRGTTQIWVLIGNSVCNREEKPLPHVAMVEKFLDDNKQKIHSKSKFTMFQTSSYSISFNLSNLGEVFWAKSERTVSELRRRKRNFLYCVHLLHFATMVTWCHISPLSFCTHSTDIISLGN